MPARPRVSIVVPTAGRPSQLRAMLETLRRAIGDADAELVVVDDGKVELVEELPPGLPRLKRLRTGGLGPARARNAGWRASEGELVFFTDDDVLVHDGWVTAALGRFERPEVLGVEGRVLSPPWDPLFEEGIATDGPGSGLTCNVAYRRSVLEQTDGFFEGFPHPHCEDVDLSLRVRQLGAIEYERDMTVTHPPRAMTLERIARRGPWAESQLLLEQRHPGTYPRPRGVPTRVLPLWTTAMQWLGFARSERGRLITRPRRGVRWLLGTSTELLAVASCLIRLAARRA